MAKEKKKRKNRERERKREGNNPPELWQMFILFPSFKPTTKMKRENQKRNEKNHQEKNSTPLPLQLPTTRTSHKVKPVNRQATNNTPKDYNKDYH